MTADDTTRDVLARCRDLGFAAAGVCAARPASRPAAFDAWLAAGKHGEMTYLARNLPARLDPKVLVPGARSVICVADRYHDGAEDPTPVGNGVATGRIARYARGADYHRVIKRRLHTLADELAARFPDDVFRTCVDTAPTHEREHAERAGLGATGKHTLLIERGAGSYLLLGEIVTTLDLAPTPPATPDPCGTCTRCLDACPTDAITPWSVDATRCISYLTIEHRTSIDPPPPGGVADWIFGCDICQEVCPHNQPTRAGSAPVHEAYAAKRTGFPLLEVLEWTEDDRREAFRGSALKRAKLDMMKRNALLAAESRLSGCDDPALDARVRTLAADESAAALVRETARQVVARLHARR